MKNVFLLLSKNLFALCGLLLLLSCDLLPSTKKEKLEQEKRTKIEQLRKEYNKKVIIRDREWLIRHESIARNLAIQFTRDQGYSIQSINLNGQSASDTGANEVGVFSYEQPVPMVIKSAYYNFNIKTGDISNRGSLIYIQIRICYAQSGTPQWTVDYFQAFS